jgi:DtxR family Mn-dependent transcriptional regulator
MPSSTVEDYLKHIFLARPVEAGALMPMGQLAAALGVTPGTATAMVKTLAEAGLVDYEPRTGVGLTRAGEKLALRMVRRHRLLELFLVRVLGLDWSEVHEEAEELEHAVSEKVLERMDVLLGRPTADPHGDPIPTARGKLAAGAACSLAGCEPGRPMRVARVKDQDAQFLRFIERQGLTPGTPVVVDRRDPAADAVLIRLRGHESLTLGGAAAAKIMVEEAKPA